MPMSRWWVYMLCDSVFYSSKWSKADKHNNCVFTYWIVPSCSRASLYWYQAGLQHWQSLSSQLFGWDHRGDICHSAWVGMWLADSRVEAVADLGLLDWWQEIGVQWREWGKDRLMHPHYPHLSRLPVWDPEQAGPGCVDLVVFVFLTWNPCR